MSEYSGCDDFEPLMESIKGESCEKEQKIRKLVEQYPNDMELGGKVRELYPWQSRPHYPSKENKKQWNS